MVVERDFLDHWKTQLLIGLLGSELAPLYVMRLWGHCEARRTGFFEELSPAALAAICRWKGQPKKLDAALQEARWIIRDAAGVTVHQWEIRNAKLLASIANGGKGGRPRKDKPSDNPEASQPEPGNNPRVNPAEPTGNPQRTSKGREGEVREESPQRPPEGGSSDPSDPDAPSTLDALNDTIAFVCGIFGKKRKLGYEAETALGRQAEFLPLAPEEKQLLAWFYGLPIDDTDITLRSRRKDADKLAIHLLPELDRAKNHAKKMGAGFGPKKNSAPIFEPTGWREWFGLKFPRAVMPAAWADVDGRQQAEFHAGNQEAPAQ
jgi:hypothetical protein